MRYVAYVLANNKVIQYKYLCSTSFGTLNMQDIEYGVRNTWKYMQSDLILLINDKQILRMSHKDEYFGLYLEKMDTITDALFKLLDITQYDDPVNVSAYCFICLMHVLEEVMDVVRKSSIFVTSEKFGKYNIMPAKLLCYYKTLSTRDKHEMFGGVIDEDTFRFKYNKMKFEMFLSSIGEYQFVEVK